MMQTYERARMGSPTRVDQDGGLYTRVSNSVECDAPQKEGGRQGRVDTGKGKMDDCSDKEMDYGLCLRELKFWTARYAD